MDGNTGDEFFDDGNQYRVTDRGAFRLEVWEAAVHPPGLVKWSVSVYVPEAEWWFTLERSHNGWTRDRAESHGVARLEHWATTYDGCRHH